MAEAASTSAPPAGDTRLAAAARAHLAGRLAEAEQGYRSALAQQPDNPTLRYYLGALLGERGDVAAARDELERAARAAPADPTILASLAGLRYRAGDPAGAWEAAEAALAQAPEEPTARFYLAAAQRQQDEPAAAAATLDRLLAAGTTSAAVYAERGEAAARLGDRSAAAQFLAEAAARAPQRLSYAIRLAELRRRSGAAEAAQAALDAAAQAGRGRAAWHRGYGFTLDALGERRRAARCLLRAVELGAGDAATFIRLPWLLSQQGRLGAAEAILRLGIERLRADPAAAAADLAELRNSLGGALREQGRIAAAQRVFELAVAGAPASDAAETNLLLMRHYDPAWSPAALYRAHRAWRDRHAAQADASRDRPVPGPPDKPVLTVGLLGNKLRLAPPLLLSLAALEHLDPQEFRLIVYDQGSRSDPMAERLAARAAAWRSIGGHSDADVAAAMRADGLDILINKMGHAEGRLGVCARKPAPVQVQWGGYNTTGLDSMDWFLGDPVETPPEAEPYFTERIYRLPHDYACYTPTLGGTAELAPPPVEARGAVSFGCLNAPTKITPATARLWGRLLAAEPASRLVLKGAVFDDPSASAHLLARLAAAGIPRERLALYGRTPHLAHLRTYNEIDIALDTWPYSGGVTTLEALWMGLPVVTLPGPSFVGRHAATHLTAAGLAEGVVASESAYLDRALAWARDPAQLASLRAGLRDRLRRSPAADGPRFARDLAKALRAFHRRASTGEPG